MLNSRIGRSPLGAFIRSPLGALIKRTEKILQPIASCRSNFYHLLSGPGGTEPNQTDTPTWAYLQLLGSTSISDGISSTYSRRTRVGFTFTLAASYPNWKKFKLYTQFADHSSGTPNIYLSSVDKSSLYSNNSAKTIWDWESALDTQLGTTIPFTPGVSGKKGTPIEISYSTISPFFGGNISFVIGDNNDFTGDTLQNRNYYLSEDRSTGITIPFLSIK